jgi:hypothetical protein
MENVAYTPRGAAKATGATEPLILEMIRLNVLAARDIEGVPVILREDLASWVRSLPVWDR